jgi:hypothetical protein
VERPAVAPTAIGPVRYDHVSRLLTTGSYQEETGRQLAAARGELSQLEIGWVAYDSDEHGLAQRYLTQAREAGSRRSCGIPSHFATRSRLQPEASS